MQSKAPIMLAIDPGYDRVGWSVGVKEAGQLKVLGYGLIQTKKQDTIYHRFQLIEQTLGEIISQYHPQQGAIENLFFSKNQTTAMRVAEIRGVILALFLRHELRCFEYNPGQIKQAVTGNGKADKRAVEKMVRLQLHLPAAKLVDDTLDALAILLTHATQLSISQ